MVMAQLESPFRTENGPVELDLETASEGLYIDMTLAETTGRFQ
jgi:hypothetical protein